MTERSSEYERERLAKIEALRDAGIDPYPVTFTPTAHAADLHGRHGGLEAGGDSGETVTVAGRLMLQRAHGKLAFGVVQDASGQIQLFVEQARLGDDAYIRFNDLDLGDWVGATGEVVKTKRGELSVRVSEVVLLAKSLRPMPAKWHGLRDVELRYRQRYLDLLMNDDARKIATTRPKVVDAIRRFLIGRDFIEVETPMLQATPGGALAKPFVTHHNALDMDLFLRIAPELYLKRLIVGGMDRVFEINRNFRNEGVGVKYNPEFTMLEAYQAYGDYFTMMDLLQELVPSVAQEVLGTTDLTYLGRPMPLGGPYPRRRLVDLASEAVGESLDLDMAPDKAASIASSHGVGIDPKWGTGKVILEIYEKLVEPKLHEPTFVLDFPREVSPLARPHRDDPRFTEHFDLVIAGMEVGPAYSELNDPVDQRARFAEQARHRAAGDEEAMALDEDFLAALEHGMPPTGGLGFGIDRFTMILTDSPSIRDVILFPLLRPEAD
jgi:lysyl-tRNA synthetase class 2